MLRVFKRTNVATSLVIGVLIIVMVVVGYMYKQHNKIINGRASFDCHGKLTNVQKMICSNPKLGEEDINILATYNKLHNALIINEDDRLSDFEGQQQSWNSIINIRNTCTNIECLSNAYASRLKELDDVLNSAPEDSGGGCGIKYQEVFETFSYFESGLEKNNPDLVISALLDQYKFDEPYIYVTDGSESQPPIFLTYGEFKKYFALLFKPPTKRQEKWRFGLNTLGDGGCQSYSTSIGTKAALDPSGNIDMLNSFDYTIGTLPQFEIFEIPVEVKQLSEQKYKALQTSKDIVGIYASKGGILWVKRTSPTEIGIVLRIAQRDRGEFNGKTIQGSQKNKIMEFVETDPDPEEQTCHLTVNFLSTTAEVTSTTSGCDKLHGQGATFGDTYYRVTNSQPTLPALGFY